MLEVLKGSFLRKKESCKEEKRHKLSPINLCKQGCNGGSYCSEKNNYIRQQTCYFFEKKGINIEECIYSRKEIDHCDNHLAQRGKI